jgi:hypothetical protein
MPLTVLYDVMQMGHFNTLNAKSNPIYHLLALLGAHLILHVNRIRVNRSVKRKVTTVVLASLAGTKPQPRAYNEI